MSVKVAGREPVTSGGCARVSVWFLYWLGLFAERGAFAQATATNTKTTFEIWMPAVSALLGGLISGILGPLLKDVVIQRWNERRSDQRLREQIEQSYFAPLSASAEKLTWRMSELLLVSD